MNAFDGIDEAVVYGVAVPGTDGRAGMAAITPADSAADFDWAGLVAHLRPTLPAYAVPVFASLRAVPATTGTMKYHKTEPKNAGYTPTDTAPVYWLAGDADRYRPLDEATRQCLNAGERAL